MQQNTESQAVRNYRDALAVCPFASIKLEAAMESVIAELKMANTSTRELRYRFDKSLASLEKQLEAVTKERDKLREALEFVATHTEHIEGIGKECQVCKIVDEALKSTA